MNHMGVVDNCDVGVYCPRLFNLSRDRNYTLSGFFQSWRYFHHVLELIRRNFRFTPSVAEAARKTLLILSPTGKVTVGVHVRRGDINSPYNAKIGYAMASEGFIVRAMQTFRSKFKDMIFIVVSDDIEWCKKTLDRHNDTVFVQENTSLDLEVLAECHHNVVTSGTFGWWGAWLAGGETIYFWDYLKPNSSLASQYKLSDYYPPTWTPAL